MLPRAEEMPKSSNAERLFALGVVLPPVTLERIPPLAMLGKSVKPRARKAGVAAAPVVGPAKTVLAF